ncbi:MarR family transcriptional regulator [Aquaticitalea lipolytica]|uniref:MarR family transcriptional regulator n=1 Tax=Aquaticitalea lipolytica TaxID=1247562 RepID=A0A8J2TP71_9FLAO|nr:MarR family transcriptional regulator [Aquaticitalea lipolytica]GFZ79263.1 MarR family transcriptional regulator [Aquaticitalea lipolytica]
MKELEDILKTSKTLPLSRKTIINVFLSNTYFKDEMLSVLKPFDLSVEQFNVLRILRGQNEKPLNLQDIQDRMVNKMSNTTRLIDKLLLKGFVERNTCAKNRRKIEIFITQDGLKTLSVLDPIIDDIEQQMTSNLSQTELEQLNNLLTKLKA